MMALGLELYKVVVRQLYKKLKYVNKDFKNIKRRKRLISTAYFNINIYFEEQSLKDFLFRTEEIDNSDRQNCRSRWVLIRENGKKRLLL